MQLSSWRDRRSGVGHLMGMDGSPQYQHQPNSRRDSNAAEFLEGQEVRGGHKEVVQQISEQMVLFILIPRRCTCHTIVSQACKFLATILKMAAIFVTGRICDVPITKILPEGPTNCTKFHACIVGK